MPKDIDSWIEAQAGYTLPEDEDLPEEKQCDRCGRTLHDVSPSVYVCPLGRGCTIKLIEDFAEEDTCSGVF